jgi:SAM-dependent methyltransferase
MNTAPRLPAKYGHERLTPLNMDSCIVRRGLARAGWHACERWARETSGGRVLDTGCGAQPYRPWIEAVGLRYEGVDWPQSIHAPEAAGIVRHDLNARPWPFESETYDGLLCTEVLEHIPDPGAFLREAARVLKPGGLLVLTTPFVWPEHEAPHDYFRYTQFGLTRLAAQAGFTVECVEPRGGWHAALAQILGLWSYHAVGKPFNYLTRLAVWPVMAVLAALDRGDARPGGINLTLDFTLTARRCNGLDGVA